MAVTGPKLPHERQRCDRSGAAPNQALLTVRGAAVAPRRDAETGARAAPIAGIATTSGGGRDPALGPATVGTVLALMEGPGCGPLRIPLNSVRTRRRSMPLKNTSGSSI